MADRLPAETSMPVRAATEPLLVIENLKAGYGPTEILRGLSMAVGSGEVVAVLGSNGVGKTTLNKVMSGVEPARSGRIRFLGEDITNAPPPAIVARGLIHVPEGRKIFPNMTVRENLELGSYRRGKVGRAANLERVFAIFPRLRERVAQLAGTLSGGEQQMLAIGRGLMAEPRLLILDEPSLGLSPLLVEEMFTLVKRIHAEGLAVLLVEQNVMQSLEIASRAYILENGVFALSGAAAELAASDDLRRAYLGM
jgi:branched-chain amino acid transport system ATP-binding protein